MSGSPNSLPDRTAAEPNQQYAPNPCRDAAAGQGAVCSSDGAPATNSKLLVSSPGGLRRATPRPSFRLGLFTPTILAIISQRAVGKTALCWITIVKRAVRRMAARMPASVRNAPTIRSDPHGSVPVGPFLFQAAATVLAYPFLAMRYARRWLRRRTCGGVRLSSRSEARPSRSPEPRWAACVPGALDRFREPQ